MEPTGGNYLEEEGNVIHGDTASPCPLRAHEPDASYCNAIGKESVRSTDAFRLCLSSMVELSAGSGSCGFASRQDQDPHQ